MSDFALAFVVGCRHAPILEEDEELRAPRLDERLQLAPGGMRSWCRDQVVEPPLGLAAIGAQGAVGQLAAPPTDTDRPLQQLGQLWRDPGVAAIGRVLDVAQDVGEADLLGLGDARRSG